MSTPSPTEGSLQGLGAGLMLPARGNPFEKAPPPPSVELLAVGAERATPELVNPAPSNAPPDPLTPASVTVEVPAASMLPEVPMPDPRDLTPEDLMALFPSTHAERDIPQQDSSASAPAAPEPLPDWMLTAPPEAPAAPVITTAPVTEVAPVVAASEPQPALSTPESVTPSPVAALAIESVPAPVVEVSTEPASPTAAVETSPAMPETAAGVEAPPTAPADTGVLGVPASPVVTTIPVASSAPAGSAPAQPQRGVRLGVIAAQGGGAEMTLNLTNDGLQTATFNPGDSLPANTNLTRMFVPDGRLMTLWLEIDAVETEVTATKGMSQNVASEMLDRLMRARNLLMNDRAQFEEAARQVAEVKFHLTNFRGTTFVQRPLFISLYLLTFFALVLAGVFLGRNMAWDQLQIFGTKLDMLWYTMLVGGIGGFTGAVYSLVQHVARDRDYDPQFALWYYQNPWMGLVLGIFVYIAVYILMNMGTLVMTGQVTSGSLLSVLITLFFAWLVGFKHNIAFDLADMAMKKLLPTDQPPAPTDADSTKPPAANK